MNAILKSRDTPPSPLETLGHLLKRDLRSEADVLGLIERGVTEKTYQLVAHRLGLPKDAIGPETTIRNRLRTHARLNADESERLVRIARVYAGALSLFGTAAKALAWMNRPARFVPDKPPITPMALATRDAGVRLLEEKLLRTAHGML